MAFEKNEVDNQEHESCDGVPEIEREYLIFSNLACTLFLNSNTRNRKA